MDAAVTRQLPFSSERAFRGTMLSNIVVSRKLTLISGFEGAEEEDAICVPYQKAAHVSILIKTTKKDIYGFVFAFLYVVALLRGMREATLL
jgi:hypothetical protein